MGSSNPNDGYVLGRDEKENERLKWQNALLIRCVGYTLHPNIAARLGTTALNVAEIASGAGSFLIDLAKELDSSSKIHGTDIGSAAWEPYEHELPANVSMSVVDAKEPVAEERRGKYDLVCIRFMNVANRPDDWGRVAEHASGLLRKGGAIQWIEGDFLQCGPLIPYTHPGDSTAAIARVYNKSLATFPHLDFFVANLKPLLEKAGFTDVRQEIASMDRVPSMRREVSTMCFGAMASMMRVKQRMKAPDAVSDEELEALVRDGHAEFDGGAYLRINLHTFVGWKG